MKEYRPRLDTEELFTAYLALGLAIEQAIDGINKSQSLQECDFHAAQLGQFCDLYVKFRSLTGHRAAAELRVEIWSRNAASAAQLALARFGK
jgi:hypothetical protein